uniref:Uncharacterized protein n=1 Tax=Leviviridae sp. TaxID=2027243 RepID=A0A514D1H1_9VIRU|nr:MAG: hypothetical protein H4Rhizo43279_000003 [Leviviridae sp.]
MLADGPQAVKTTTDFTPSFPNVNSQVDDGITSQRDEIDNPNYDQHPQLGERRTRKRINLAPTGKPAVATAAIRINRIVTGTQGT